MAMRIATWNVNSVRQRLDHLLAWLQERSPDIVCLQEIKCMDDAFPREPIEALGYNVVTHGQKTFNGVALLSKYRFDETTPRLGGDPDDLHARFLRAWCLIRTAPCGSHACTCPMGTLRKQRNILIKSDGWNGFDYTKERMKGEQPLVLAGDFNVIPANGDVYNPAAWANDALFLPKTRERFRALLNLGLTDAIRAVNDQPGQYTFWDYQAGAWPKNNGIRIDHLLLSPQASDRLQDAGIDRHVRGWEKASDHVPVWIDLDLD
jgi:exodeoxyribonuclease-3